MKQTLKIASVLCGVLTIAALITGIRALTGNGYFFGLALFSMVRHGTVMGFFGNLVEIAFTCGGFGAMTYYGLTAFSNTHSRKMAFIWGCVMSVLCIISMFFSMAAGSFNLGDFIVLALPMVYTFAVFRIS